jgi:hypothetical protein
VRIGIGALLGITGGPATYARELVSALARLGGHDYVVFTDRPEAFAGLDVTPAHVPLPTSYHQVTWDHGRLRRLLAEQRIDLYHGTKAVLPWRLRSPPSSPCMTSPSTRIPTPSPAQRSTSACSCRRAWRGRAS